MGIRSKTLGRVLAGQNLEGDIKLILLNLLEVQEEILDELRAQNTIDDEEEQGPTSLSDR